MNETRNKSYERLAKIGGKVGIDEKELLKLLWIDDKPGKDGSLNTGNGVTNDLKVLVKMNRMQGVSQIFREIFSIYFPKRAELLFLFHKSLDVRDTPIYSLSKILTPSF